MSLWPRGTMMAILRGMGLIARGRAEGLNCFADTPRAFLGSLLPGLGFMGGAVIEGVAEGEGAGALAGVLVPLCALLAPPVLSHELARLWGREAFWLRYIVAYNWSRWLLVALMMAVLMGLSAGRMGGLIGQGGFRLGITALAGYALWLNWFVARHGLALTGGRAALLVVGVNLGTLLLVFLPSLFSGHTP